MTEKEYQKKYKQSLKCECSDPGCPVHPGKSECSFGAKTTVRRIDMEDGDTRFRMCVKCADDSLSSGVFA